MTRTAAKTVVRPITSLALSRTPDSNDTHAVQVPQDEETAAPGPAAVVRDTPSVALVRPQAVRTVRHRRPVARVPAQGLRGAPALPAADQPVGQPVVRHRVQPALRAAVPDGGGDEREPAARGRAQGRAAAGGRDGVQCRVRGTLHGHAARAQRGRAPGQSHRAVRVRGRGGRGRAGLPVGTARPVRAAPGRPPRR